MLSPVSVPATGIVPMLCPFFLQRDIFLSSPALATTKSAEGETPIEINLSHVYIYPNPRPSKSLTQFRIAEFKDKQKFKFSFVHFPSLSHQSNKL